MIIFLHVFRIKTPLRTQNFNLTKEGYLDTKFENSKLVRVLKNFRFVSFSKVIIYIYRYRAIDIHCTD